MPRDHPCWLLLWLVLYSFWHLKWDWLQTTQSFPAIEHLNFITSAWTSTLFDWRKWIGHYRDLCGLSRKCSVQNPENATAAFSGGRRGSTCVVLKHSSTMPVSFWITTIFALLSVVTIVKGPIHSPVRLPTYFSRHTKTLTPDWCTLSDAGDVLWWILSFTFTLARCWDMYRCACCAAYALSAGDRWGTTGIYRAIRQGSSPKTSADRNNPSISRSLFVDVTARARISCLFIDG